MICDNCYYEKVGNETKNITAELPFEIPATWTWCRLKSIISLKSGDAIKVTGLGKDGEFPVYGGNGINGFFDKFNVPSNTIIIGRVGFYCGSIHLTNSNSWVTDNALIVTHDDNINVNFLTVILEALNLSKTSNSTAQPVVSGKGILPLFCPIPPINEQLQIANQYNRILNKIGFIQKDISNLNEIIKLTKYKVLDYYFGENSCYKSYYEKIGVLTDDVEILDYLRKPINSTERLERLEKASVQYPYYGSTGLTGYIDDYLLNGEYILLGEDAAPFLDKNANKAYLINGKSWVNNHAHILKSKTSNKYLLYYLNWFDYSTYVSGTTRLKLSQANMKKIPFPSLKKEIKDKIVSQIETTFNIIEKIKEQLI